MHNQIEIKCNTCGGALLTWTKKYAEGTTLCGKCAGCKKLWRMEFDKQGEMLDATVEDYED